ncbi:MAG TPA: lysylphosphatidylglycerol synthase transmembrane domain-containing protein [Bacillota bacterium]|nr:lysylphosphatidylglycerol synthase transmembrane domain-containing protein [Bacillota bacterium]
MGKNTHFLKRNWKVIVNVVTLVALAVLIYAIRHQIVDTFNNLAKVNIWILALMIPIQAFNYHAQTKIYQDLFRLVGSKLSYKFVYRAALELNFVNHVFPSGGVSGISYFGMRMRRGDISGGKATLVQLMKLILLIVSFEILLIAGLFIMAVNGRASNLIVLFSGSVSTLMVVGTFAFVFIIGSEKRIHVTFSATTMFLNRLIHVFRPNYPETISIDRAERLVQEFHGNYKLIETNYRELKWPFFWSLVANFTEVMTIYIVYIAFGEWVNIGAIILAYAVANFAGFVSVLPGGVGIYEALMTGVLAAAGIPAALSLPVTVMYRVFSTIIQIPPGYYLYHKTLHKTEEPS